MRYDVIMWLETEEDEEDDDEEVLDVSNLYGETIIETGVTSGADPTDWESIDLNIGDQP